MLFLPMCDLECHVVYKIGSTWNMLVRRVQHMEGTTVVSESELD